jgi:hypothetical protein
MQSKKAILIWFFSIVALLVIFAIIGKSNSSNIEQYITDAAPVTKSPNWEIVRKCTADMFTQFHIHPVLEIFIDGKQEIIPANTGITANCMSSLHTHDTTGTLHVESPVKRDFTLGDFFAVWGKVLTHDQILDNKIDATHIMTMTVNGKPSTEFEDLVLADKDLIVINYDKKK